MKHRTDARVSGLIARADTKVFGCKMLTTFVVAFQQSFVGADGERRVIDYYSNCKVWNVVGERIPRKGDSISVSGRLTVNEYNQTEIQVRAYTIG